jgi:hypothetical protein
MITKFKLFERAESTSELIDEFDDNYIEEYFDENFGMSAKEIVEYWPSTISRLVDEEEFIKDFISDMCEGREISEFDDMDIKDYIINNQTTRKEEKIIEIYKRKKEDEEDEEDEKLKQDEEDEEELEYDDDLLDDFDKDELIEVIEDCNEESELIEYLMNSCYGKYTVDDYISEFFGKNATGKDLMKTFGNYLDDDKIEKDYLDNTDFDYKKETVEENIHASRDLQEELLEINPENSIALAELFIDNSGEKNISNEYNFQKAYIESYLMKKIEDEEIDEKNEREKSTTIAEAVKYLYDNFSLNSDIEEEYEEYMWMITSDKYNI